MSKAEKRAVGRGKRVYSAAVGESICDLVAEGAGLMRAAREVGVSYKTVRRWLAEVNEFAAGYEAACKARLDWLQERLADLCAQGHEVAAGAEDTARARVQLEAVKLELEAVKWQLCKLLPERFGERSSVEVTGRDGADLLPRHTVEEIEAYARMVAKAREKCGMM